MLASEADLFILIFMNITFCFICRVKTILFWMNRSIQKQRRSCIGHLTGQNRFRENNNAQLPELLLFLVGWRHFRSANVFIVLWHDAVAAAAAISVYFALYVCMRVYWLAHSISICLAAQQHQPSLILRIINSIHTYLWAVCLFCSLSPSLSHSVFVVSSSSRFAFDGLWFSLNTFNFHLHCGLSAESVWLYYYFFFGRHFLHSDFFFVIF